MIPKLLDTNDVAHLPEFQAHEAIYRMNDETSGLQGFIAIHCRRGTYPSLGATRLWRYAGESEALRDALRLSNLMTYKSALAGLPYGGAKAVLMEPEGRVVDRTVLFRAYAEMMNALGGQFITGTDVGLTNDDLAIMVAGSPYVIGGGVNAGYATALGVFFAIEAAMQEHYGAPSVAGRTFAIQGIGKTGGELLQLLVKHNAERIVVADLHPDLLREAALRSPSIQIVSPEDIHKQAVDIFCPCALSGAINEATLPELRAWAVVGAANNQLAHKDFAERLHRAGILYAPDYVVNAGGFISVVDQYEHGAYDEVRVLRRLRELQERIAGIFRESVKRDEPPSVIADRFAMHEIAETARR